MTWMSGNVSFFWEAYQNDVLLNKCVKCFTLFWFWKCFRFCIWCSGIVNIMQHRCCYNDSLRPSASSGRQVIHRWVVASYRKWTETCVVSAFGLLSSCSKIGANHSVGSETSGLSERCARLVSDSPMWWWWWWWWVRFGSFLCPTSVSLPPAAADRRPLAGARVSVWKLHMLRARAALSWLFWFILRGKEVWTLGETEKRLLCFKIRVKAASSWFSGHSQMSLYANTFFTHIRA